MQLNITLVVRQFCLVDRAKCLDIISLRLRLVVGQVVVTEHDVLRDVQHWRTVGRLQQVVSSAHQLACLGLCFLGERQVHGHLVTVKVGVKSGTDQRVQLNCFTFDEDWLEGLN